jgi:hypothetical protein
MNERIGGMYEIHVAHSPRSASLRQKRRSHFGLTRERVLDLRQLDDARSRIRSTHTRRHRRNEGFVVELQEDLIPSNAR